MLSEAQIEEMIKPILQRQYQINNFVVTTIAERIREIGRLAPTDLHRLEQLYRSGADVRKINAEIARLTGLQVRDIKSLIREVALDGYIGAKPFYDYRHRPFLPIAKNVTLQRAIEAIARQTTNTYINMSKAQGFMVRNAITRQLQMTSIAKTYQTAIDRAIQATQQGVVDYNTAMRSTMKDLINSGLRRVSYESEAGKQFTQRMDTAVRRNVLDGVRAINQAVQDITGEQYGADGKEMSVHMNPAPDHEYLQGHQYTNANFEKMQNAEPFEDVDGRKYSAIERAIGTLNCRHFMYSIIIGYAQQNFSNKELQDIIDKNHKGYTNAKGKHMTMYECTQYQRQLETKIRYAKDGQIAAKASGDMELAKNYQRQIDKYTTMYKHFSNECGLAPKMKKATVSGYRRISLK